MNLKIFLAIAGITFGLGCIAVVMAVYAESKLEENAQEYSKMGYGYSNVTVR